MSPSRAPSGGWWVIVDGTTATSFRARTRETLLPTLVQLQRTQPDVRLRWAERGRIWESQDAAREAFIAERLVKRRQIKPEGWRPGGAHKDPRARFELSRDQKRARFKSRRFTRPLGADPAGKPPGKPGKK